MDTFTQSLLGAAAAQSVADERTVRAATFAGLASGALADADIFLNSPTDPLYSLLAHRSFSHSVFFIPLGAFLAAILVWPFLRKWAGFGRLFLFCLAGYATHALLDCCTSYGTQFFWPFSQARIAWDNVSIIDPVFTLPLFVLVYLAARRRKRVLARGVLVFCAFYLLLGAGIHFRAMQFMRQTASARGHAISRIRVMPTLGNLVLWRSVYESDGEIHADALRMGITGDFTLFPGASIPRFQKEKDRPGLPPDSVLANDIDRFTFFANGWVALSPDHFGVLGDLRYAAVPNSLRPLWAISIHGPADGHAEMIYLRGFDADAWNAFTGMFRGNPPTASSSGNPPGAP